MGDGELKRLRGGAARDGGSGSVRRCVRRDI